MTPALPNLSWKTGPSRLSMLENRRIQHRLIAIAAIVLQKLIGFVKRYVVCVSLVIALCLSSASSLSLQQCACHNFARREACFRCQLPRSERSALVSASTSASASAMNGGGAGSSEAFGDSVRLFCRLCNDYEVLVHNVVDPLYSIFSERKLLNAARCND